MKTKSGTIQVLCIVFIGLYPLQFGIAIEKESIQKGDSIDSSSTIPDETEDWHILLEEMAENELETEEWEEVLTELANNPIALNTASREMLESIPILNAEQVENLSYYLYRYGPMVSISELMLVEGMDSRTVRWLKPFVRIDALNETPVMYPPMKKALKYGKQEIRWTIGSTLQQKRGYQQDLDSSNRYWGDPLHTSLRYGFDYKDQLQWGLVLEKDAGERWWDKNSGGVDYRSFHGLLKDSKRKNTLIVGDYSVRFGQGLVCGTNFSLGKSTTGGVPEQTGGYVSRHFSASESNYLRGAVLRLTIKPYVLEKGRKFGMELYSFVSKKRVDSSVENEQFSSITTTGLHRTRSEIETRKKLGASVLGSHLAFRWTNLTAGITATNWYYDASALPSLESWKIFQLSGNHGANASVNFRASIHGMLTFGEMALDQKGHKALLTGLSFKPHPRMSVSMLGRKYDPAYVALSSNSFSEGTSTQNEEGLFLSTDFQLAKRIRFSGFVDVFRFPWLSYRVNSPSKGAEIAGELNATIGRNGLIKLQVKSKTREKNVATSFFPTDPIQPYNKKQMRLQLSQKVGFWSMKTILQCNRHTFNKFKTDGWALAQDFGLAPSSSKFSLFLHTVIFDTPAWDNKIYLWEKDVPGAFSMPMLYGRGCRSSIFLKFNSRNLIAQLKLADTVQPNRNFLGDDLEQINGNHKTEARLQLSLKF